MAAVARDAATRRAERVVTVTVTMKCVVGERLVEAGDDLGDPEAQNRIVLDPADGAEYTQYQMRIEKFRDAVASGDITPLTAIR